MYKGGGYIDCQLTASREDHKNITVHYGGSGKSSHNQTPGHLLVVIDKAREVE